MRIPAVRSILRMVIDGRAPRPYYSMSFQENTVSYTDSYDQQPGYPPRGQEKEILEILIDKLTGWAMGHGPRLRAAVGSLRR